MVSRMGGKSMRNVGMSDDIIIGQNLSHAGIRVGVGVAAGMSSQDFPSASVDSQEIAAVVSKGGQIPDQYRQNQVRRDKYLTNLLSTRVSDKTNVIGRMVSPVPLKVKINANSAVEEKQILAPNSSGRETIARGQNASINSTTPGANGDAHRIHLNTQDIRMMKDSFRDSS